MSQTLTSESLSLKNTLDRFYREYNFSERLKHDPIEFPRKYSLWKDIEIAGFIASCFSYGKVELFKPVIEKILKPGGNHPASFFLNFELKKDGRYFESISYRFNKGKDILCLVYTLSQILKKWNSLKTLFYSCYKQKHKDLCETLDTFVASFVKVDSYPVYGNNTKPYGLTQFFPSPKHGSACKRTNLFLRWMVRTKDIDLGIWDRIPASKLIIPLDTHITKISKCLGLTKRSSSDLKTAREVTESLKKLDPEDPLKYDFALCHHGISGMCKGMNHMVYTKEKKLRNTCLNCSIKNNI